MLKLKIKSGGEGKRNVPSLTSNLMLDVHSMHMMCTHDAYGCILMCRSISNLMHIRCALMMLLLAFSFAEQVRRISVADIWGKSISHLSFKKMMAIASRYLSSGDDVDDASDRRHCATLLYSVFSLIDFHARGRRLL